MPSITREQVRVPVDVSPEMRETYIDNYMKATRNTGRLMLFACDQKIEHLNKDFYDGGEEIDIADMQCWVFRLAQQRWGLAPAECARLFREHGVLKFISESYGILHLSSYEAALEDVRRYLANRGESPC